MDQLRADLTLADGEAVADNAGTRGLFLEDRDDDLVAVEDFLESEVDDRAARRRAEAMLGRREPHEGLGTQHGLDGDPIDESAWLTALGAIGRRPVRRWLDGAATLHRSRLSGGNAGGVTAHLLPGPLPGPLRTSAPRAVRRFVTPMGC